MDVIIRHEKVMKSVLNLAQIAYESNEIPVAAILINNNGDVIQSAINSRENYFDPCGHAEINCLRAAGTKLGRWNLQNHILYTNLEPCIMCMGAVINARIGTLVYGAHDKKSGAISNLWFHPGEHSFNHKTHVIGGILEDECSKIISSFFQNLRLKNKSYN